LDENKLVERLWRLMAERPATTAEAVNLSQAAVEQCPWSAELWYLRGMILDRCESLPNITKEDYRRCYERAIECDPGFADAYVELGYVLDTYYDDFAAAERAFRKAIALGSRGDDVYVGLARVLAQQGRKRSALRLLRRVTSRKTSDGIESMIHEIEQGIWGE
jgi:Flp pilus assembly protein TadD